MKVKYLLKLLFLIIIILAVNSSCSSNKKDRFIDATVELLIIQNKFTIDSVARSNEINKIFYNYGFTPESYKETYQSYQNNNDEFLKIMDSVKTRIQKEILQLESQKNRN